MGRILWSVDVAVIRVAAICQADVLIKLVLSKRGDKIFVTGLWFE